MKSMLVAALSAVLVSACTTAHASRAVDTASTRVSKGGTYQVTYEPAVQPVPKRQVHAWTIVIRDREGRPVDGARLQIGGRMPDHGHGLPTKPFVRAALGDGRYVVDGMKFNMGGYWVVDLGIEAGPGADDVRFELSL